MKLGAVSSGVYRSSENKAVIDDEHVRPRHEVKPGDVLFSRKNTRDLVGKTVYVWETPERRMIPDLIFRPVLSDDAPITSVYLASYLRSPRTHAEVKNLASGAAASMVNISKSKLLGLAVPIPPRELQLAFEDRIRANRVAAVAAIHSVDACNLTTRAIQQLAFSGELVPRVDAAALDELEAVAQ